MGTTATKTQAMQVEDQAALKVANFVGIEEIQKLAATARTFREGVADNLDPILISDAISLADDGSTIQWTQLVLAGGGVLGIAHVGFVYVLEEAGIRFLGLGGTSAGAINAGLIAAVRSDPAAISWKETLKILATTDFSAFEDGNPYFANQRKSLTQSDGSFKSLGFFGIVSVISKALLNLKALKGAWDKMGLHPANSFSQWLTDNFAKFGVKTQADLEARMTLNQPVKLRRCNGQVGTGPLLGMESIYRRKAIKDRSYFATARFEDKHVGLLAETDLEQTQPLKLVTSEVATQSKVVWPEDAELFYMDPKNANPADFVRSSMSVPVFFQPFSLGEGSSDGNAGTPPLPNAGLPDPKWAKNLDYRGNVPKTAVFVDGGTLSNFPINLFHNLSKVPLFPTLGIQLSVDREKAQPIDSVIDLIRSMNNSSRKLLDRDFIERNPDFKQLVASVDTTGFGFLNFDMPLEAQQRLFVNGMKTAIAFLEGWRAQGGKWAAYQKLREDMIKGGS